MVSTKNHWNIVGFDPQEHGFLFSAFAAPAKYDERPPLTCMATHRRIGAANLLPVRGAEFDNE
ncbi:hypothetical protein [Mesorhizobium sp. LjNodule214]|uniref:hypothetical protein n=1 Tax=Mesorhizobium sp. LjNodule214 TaxID=3342252 RepID=UPI003ECD5C75